MQNQSGESLRSDTKKNLKDCMAITLMSGRELENIEEEKKKQTTDQEKEKTGRDNKLNNSKITVES